MQRLEYDTLSDRKGIARTIEALEYKRHETLAELKKYRSWRYRLFSRVQDSTRNALASQAERDYERLQQVVTNLAVFTKAQQPSRRIFPKVIEKISVEISEQSDQISPYRLRLAYGIEEIIKLLSARLVVSDNGSITDRDYQKLIEDLRSRSRILSKQLKLLLKEKYSSDELAVSQKQQISDLSGNISSLYGDVANYKVDLDNLKQELYDSQKSFREKQEELDLSLSDLSNLSREVIEAREVSETKQNSIKELKSKIHIIEDEKASLERDIRKNKEHSASRILEIEALERQNSQLNILRDELLQKEKKLMDLCRSQRMEILSLSEKIKSLNQEVSAKSMQSDQVNATKAKLSLEEYNRIPNKSDYTYVKRHKRRGNASRRGSWVKAHYRRRRSR